MTVTYPTIWNVPYQRNPFFTGRDDVLHRLHNSLNVKGAAALAQPQGISGLGGIGKTQTAIEYAYRYRSEYQAVLWVRADSQVALASDFIALAHVLDLPEKNEQDQNRIITAVMRWFKDHTHWLLVLDNADDLNIVSSFIPAAHLGHILLTTRAHATGRLARRIEIQKMTPEEGALLLLHRTSLLVPEAHLDEATATVRAEATKISQALDGLPLALDQAGAYIVETDCELSDYLHLYQSQREQILTIRGQQITDYPASVATTWSISFARITQVNPAAAELLKFCAFLYPEAIPEEIFIKGSSDLGPILQSTTAQLYTLNEAMRELLKFSLLQRSHSTRTYNIHRLVQAVLMDEMDTHTKYGWAERTVRAVNDIFPNVKIDTWPGCQRCILQAQTCTTLIEQWDMAFPEVARLLSQIASYVHDLAQYTEAEFLYQRAQTLYEQILGPEHLGSANNLGNLALLYTDQGRYTQAEPLIQRVLAIKEKVLGLEHPETAVILNNLAELYRHQGHYEQVEPLLKRALAIKEKALGPEHADVTNSLNNLALLYYVQGKYEQAEPLYWRALTIKEKVLGPEHPDVAISLNNLALLYYNQGRYEQAEPLYWRALTTKERVLGPEHPDTANGLSNLAMLSIEQEKYEQAESLLKRALTIREKVLGPEHPDTAKDLNNLGELYRNLGQFQQAEPFYQRAISIKEKVFGLEHPDTAISLNNLALLYSEQGRYRQAIPLYQRALAINVQVLGPENPITITTMEDYAHLLRKVKREDEATALETRIKAMRDEREQEKVSE